MDPIRRHRAGGEKLSRDFSDLQSALCHERDISLHVRGDDLYGQYGLPFGTDADIEKEIPEGAAAAGAHDDDFCGLHRPLYAGFRKHHAGRLLAKAHYSFPRCVYGFSGGGTSGHCGRPEASGGGTGLYRFRHLSPGLRQGQDRKRWDPRDTRYLPLLSGARLCRRGP